MPPALILAGAGAAAIGAGYAAGAAATAGTVAATAGSAAAVAGATEAAVLGASSSLMTLKSVLYTVGGSLLMGAINQALMPRPRRPDYDGRRHTIQSAEVFERISYGRAIVPANLVRVFPWGSANGKLIMILYIATQESDGIEEIFINGKRVLTDVNGTTFSGMLSTDRIPRFSDQEGGRQFWQDGAPKFGVAYHLGTPDQQVDPRAHDKAPDNGWPTTARMTGHTYARLELWFHPSVWSSLPDVTFLVRGRRVYDPRTGQRVWSANPALCIADFLQHKFASSFGLICDEDSLVAAANVCDEPVPVQGGGTRPRYQLHGYVSSDQNPRDVLKDMLATMAGTIVVRGRTAKIYAGAVQAPVRVLRDDDFDESIELRPHRSRSERVNAVTAWISDEEKNYERQELPVVSDRRMIAEDGGELRASLDLAWVTNRAQAAHLQRIALRQARAALSLTTTLTVRHRDLEPMDVVIVDLPRYGLSNRQMIVRELSMGSDQKPVVTLTEYDPTIFDWSTAEEPQPRGTSGPDVAFPSAPDAPVLTLSVERTNDLRTYMVRVAWPVPPVDAVLELDWRHDQIAFEGDAGALGILSEGYGYETDEPWSSHTAVGSVGSLLVGPVRIGHRIVVRARWRIGEATSDESSASIWIKDLPPVPGPDRLRVSQVSREGDVELRWDPPPYGTAWRYEIWVSRREDNLSDAVMIEDDARGRRHRLPALEAGPAWFWVRGCQEDGTTTTWSPSATIEIVPRLKRLAEKDKVGTADIEVEAITSLITVASDTKENVSTSWSDLLTWSTDTPVDPTNPLRTYAVRIDWEFRVPGGGNSTGADVRIERSSDGVRWGDTIEMSRRWAQGATTVAYGFMVAAHPQGRRWWRLRAKMINASQTLRDIRAVTTLMKG